MPAGLLEMSCGLRANAIGVTIRIPVYLINCKVQVLSGACQQHFFVCFHTCEFYVINIKLLGATQAEASSWVIDCPPTTLDVVDCLLGIHIRHAFSSE